MTQYLTCTVCQRHVPYRGRTAPRHCGQGYCRAVVEWGPAEWAGRAEMARGRQACGLDLNAWDLEALRRDRPS